MRESLKKLGSLTLGAGALVLVLANAALTHGCARSSTAQVTPQTAPPSEDSDSPTAKGSANPNCTPPSYMYATKAPIWVPPECYSGNPVPTQPPQQVPIQGANAEQQAP